MSITSWSEWFDRAAKTFEDPRMKIAYYSNAKTGTPYSRRAVLATMRHIWDKLKPRPSHIILDVGCGVGYFTQVYSKKVKQVIGVDIAPNMIKSAYELNPKGFFLVSRADVLCFKSKQFDRIFSYGVTQYMANDKAVESMLDEILSLIKPNGRILVGDILEPIENSPAGFYKKKTVKGKRWWPKTLDHDLTKFYVPKEFFIRYCKKHNLSCRFFNQKLSGRHIPTPRYDVVIEFN